MDTKHSHPKWEIKVSTTLAKASADQIWPLFSDFFGLHKWFPGLPTCYGIHGANGELGCVRYCAGFGLPPENDDHQVSWSKERLIAFDPIGKKLSYEIVDCNIGFKSYVSTVQIFPCSGDGQDHGCLIEWSIAVDPVEGVSLEDLVIKYQVGLNGMANKMDDAVTS